ncbi:ankyrin repeat-containing domain protein [Chytriomyces cf. hyalinus JEL632]|nr:ankyrin repeat-containing domain protein [Chytriomyces cf. hyalinus JEL632]
MLHNLPLEILHSILLNLPIESNLAETGLSCRRIGRLLLNDCSFAIRHTRITFDPSKLSTATSTWSLLPVPYKAAVLSSLSVTTAIPLTIQCSHALAKRLIACILKNFKSYSPNWSSLLSWCCCGGHEEAVQLILENRKTDRLDISSAFRNACIARKSSLALLLLHDTRFDPNDRSCVLGFMWAARLGYEDVVAKLLAFPEVDPGIPDNYALEWSSKMGHVGVVKLLLRDSRTDVAVNQHCALRWAAEAGRTSVVKLLLSDGRSDPFACGGYALEWAIRNQHEEVVQALLADKRISGSTREHFTREWCRRFIAHNAF